MDETKSSPSANEGVFALNSSEKPIVETGNALDATSRKIAKKLGNTPLGSEKFRKRSRALNKTIIRAERMKGNKKVYAEDFPNPGDYYTPEPFSRDKKQ